MEKQRLSTDALVYEHHRDVERTRQRISALKPSSKRWWKSCNALMLKSGNASSIPPLLAADGNWFLEPSGKAQCFAASFADKVHLPASVGHDAEIDRSPRRMSGLLPIRPRQALEIL